MYLITHVLDFDVLFFGMRNNSLHLLLQLCDSRFLFLNLLSLFLQSAVLFEKFIEQHRVHRVVAHGVNLAVVVAHNQVGIDLSYLLRD